MLKLTDTDRDMLSGLRGPAVRLAMSIVTQMAEVQGAAELMDITAAHIDSTIYIGEAGLEFAERLAGLGARVSVPSSLNVSGVDENHWQEWPVPEDWARNARRQMVAYRCMGGIPTWTCAPYQVGIRPQFGQQVAWGESNAIAFVNSVLGARTERYPDLLDICCAITGRVPAIGLHLSENRAGELLLDLVDVPIPVQMDDRFYPVLGYLIGRIAQDRIPVVAGMSVQPGQDQLKAMCATAASSGTVALVHLVGITPEAPSLAAAFLGRPPPPPIGVTMDDLDAARRALSTAEGDSLDMVILGCPHVSLDEFARLAALVEGKHTHSAVRFLVASSRHMVERARAAGYLVSLTRFGGQITVDTCPLATPMLPPDVRTVMTDSGKHAYYAPGLLGTRVAFGSLAECVQSACAGRIVQDGSPWAT